MKNMRVLVLGVGMICIVLLISSCAEPQPIGACLDQDPDGFLNGLIHGLICPITFIVSLFNDEIAMYAVNNNGGWYNFGFLIGAAIILGGGARSR